MLREPCCAFGQLSWHHSTDWLQTPLWSIWWQASGSRQQYPELAIRSRYAPQRLGDRHHLYQNPWGVVISGSRDWFVLVAHCRLVHSIAHDNRPRLTGIVERGLAAQTKDQGNDPLWSGFTIHQQRVASFLANTICAPVWAGVGVVMTTQWLKASSSCWNANVSGGGHTSHVTQQGKMCSIISRCSTTQIASTRTTACCRRLIIKKDDVNWTKQVSRKIRVPQFP